ncbi:MAG: transporter substrate-binding domain-containing protein [Campylobacter sp.]|nr:transporter substrate-binding domain-containing protein [Campylobacter sp.]
MKILVAIFLSLSVLLGIEIKVGSENTYKPFAYLDEKNSPTGYDNEVIKIVASYIKDAKLNFVSVPWNAIFSGLDSAKFDIIANQIVKNKEREEKYLFSKFPYFYGVSTIITLEDKNISDIKELNNAKIGVTVGSNHANLLENYLKEHPNFKAEIVYYKTSPTLVADLKNKRLDAIVNDPIAVIDYAKAQNIKVRPSEFAFEKVPVYFVFRKDSTELANLIDEALEKAIKDGKISELSIKYFGVDQSQ